MLDGMSRGHNAPVRTSAIRRREGFTVVGARAVFALILSVSLIPPSSGWAADKLYLGERFGQVVMEIDVRTGDRRLFEMEDYPRVLTARNPAVDGADSFLFLAGDAIQRLSIKRYRVSTGVVEGVSGYDNYASMEPHGSGPDIGITLADMVVTPENTLLALQGSLGPMEIELDSGDRRLLAGPINPPTGHNPPMQEPLDLVWESSETILVADRFQGIFRMSRSTGDLDLPYPTGAFLSPPYNIERLPSGQILHCLSQEDHALYLFDPTTGEDQVLSSGGPFPVGPGIPFVIVWDIAADEIGHIYVYDLGIPAVFEVRAKTGERILISSSERGQGPDLLAGLSRPSLSAGRAFKLSGSGWILR
ncbi:MAG: hypothetical protein GHCLOJNM_01809 [bacterium]|nr:hypothetical protein [bacterium]